MDAHDIAPTYSTCQLRPPYISLPFLHYFYWRLLKALVFPRCHTSNHSLCLGFRNGFGSWFWIHLVLAAEMEKNQPHSTLAPHFLPVNKSVELLCSYGLFLWCLLQRVLQAHVLEKVEKVTKTSLKHSKII